MHGKWPKILNTFLSVHWRSSHYAVRLMCNKNSNIQRRSPNVVKVIFHIIKNSGIKLFPLKEVPILKREAIEENHCLVQ